MCSKIYLYSWNEDFFLSFFSSFLFFLYIKDDYLFRGLQWSLKFLFPHYNTMNTFIIIFFRFFLKYVYLYVINIDKIVHEKQKTSENVFSSSCHPCVFFSTSTWFTSIIESIYNGEKSFFSIKLVLFINLKFDSTLWHRRAFWLFIPFYLL